MTEQLKFDLLEVLVKHDVIPDIYLRDERVRSEYVALRRKGMPGKKARETLADKFITSEKNIEYIIYGKKRNKQPNESHPG